MVNEDFSKNFKKVFIWALIVLILFLSYKVLKPFLITIVSAFILAFLIYPLYSFFNKRFPKLLSASFCVLIIVAFLFLVFYYLINGLFVELASSLQQDSIISFFQTFISDSFLDKLGVNLQNLSLNLKSYLFSKIDSVVSFVPNLIIHFIVLIFGIFTILVNWDSLQEQFKKYVSFKGRDKISKELGETTKNIIYGTFFIALIQFGIAVLGFYFSGVEFYFLPSLFIFFLTFIPGFGPIIVFLPLAIYYGSMGDYSVVIGVLIAGLILTLVDFLLRAKIVGDKAKLNPFLMLVGVLGGLAFFGVIGFILGPLIVMYSIKLLKNLLNRV